MNTTYVVRLTESQRTSLRQRVAVGNAPARELLHTRVLLKADEGPNGPAWIDAEISTALEVSTSTVERVRRRFVQDGLDAALRHRPPRREYRRKLDGEQEAHLVALACTPSP